MSSEIKNKGEELYAIALERSRVLQNVLHIDNWTILKLQESIQSHIDVVLIESTTTLPQKNLRNVMNRRADAILVELEKLQRMEVARRAYNEMYRQPKRDHQFFVAHVDEQISLKIEKLIPNSLKT